MKYWLTVNLAVFAALFSSFANAQVASGSLNALLDAPPGFYDPHPNAGKVIRRKIADITPAEDRAEAERNLSELRAGASSPQAVSLCKGITVFCRVGVDNGHVGHLNAEVNAMKRFEAAGSFNVKFADLTRSDFAKFTLLGYRGGNFGQPAPWTSAARLFRSPNGDLVYLTEWDFVSTGGFITQAIEFLNAKIGNFEAIVGLNIGKSGAKLWHAKWVDMPRQVELYYSCASATCLSQSEFLALANSIYAGR